MVDITYTAREKLKSGHTSGTEYTIEVDLSRFDESPNPVQTENKTLAGTIYTDLYHIEENYSIGIDYMPATGGTVNHDDLREFLYSIFGGYSFDIDDGTTVYTLVLTGKPTISNNGAFYNYSFNARAV
ncbi:MAG: hypothetical protein HOE78_09175 [Gammaproteobacteria bacterium]|jgi:hypothetical protein|nr:hypothetical protein [Gammaproteobacteria bacterium]